MDDALERGQTVAQPRGVLVPERLGEQAEAAADPRKRRTAEEARELGFGRARERPGRQLGAAAAPDRAERRRIAAHPNAVAAHVEVEVAVGPRAAGVRRRSELPDEPQLFERRLELRAEHTPLDPLDGVERRLDGGSLAVGAEVRPQAGAEVTRLADVEHVILAAAEEVDTGPRGRSEDERALVVGAARTGRSEALEVGDRARATLLRQGYERDEDLRRRLRVRQGAVTGLGGGSEEP